MTTFTLSRQHIQAIASLSNAAEDHRAAGSTPVLTRIELQVTPAEFQATATNRYVVAQLRSPMGDHVHTLRHDTEILDHHAPRQEHLKPLTLLLPAVQLVALAKLMASRKSLWASFTTDDGDDYASPTGTVHIEDEFGDALAAIPLAELNFPPIAQLFPDDDAEHATSIVSLSPERITALSKVMSPAMLALRPANRKSVPMHFQFTKSEYSDKLGPVIVTRPLPQDERIEGETLRMLLQPSLLMNRD